MSKPTLIKQPSENRAYSMDFSALLGEGETIASVTSVTFSGPDAALTLVGLPTFSGSFVSQRIKDGTAGVRYNVTFLVVTSAGNVLEGDGILQVKEL